MARHENLGNKLGPRVVELVTRAQVAKARQLAPLWAKTGSEALQDFHGVIGEEIQAHMRGRFQELADHPDMPPDFAGLFHFIAEGSGQAAGLLSESLISQAVGTGIGDLLNNILTPIIASIMSKSPELELDFDTAVNQYVRGLKSWASATNLAARNGYDANRFLEAVNLAAQVMGPGEALELYRRGDLELGGFYDLMHRTGFDSDQAVAYTRLAETLESPPDIARAVIRGYHDQAAGAKLAARSGVTEFGFQLLLDITGQPPATMELLEAYRRGIIGKDRLEHGIKQGDIRNEWIDVIEALRFAPPGIGDVLGGVVTGHLSEAQGRDKAQEAGLAPENFDWMYQSHGRPPGAQEMVALWRRGAVTEAEVVQAIRESDIKVKYIPAILEMRRHLLPERTVASLHTKGVIPDAVARKMLTDLGVEGPDADYVLAAAKVEKTQAHRDLSQGQVLAEYDLEAVTKEAAHAKLMALGYDTHEAGEILHLQDLIRARRLQDQAVAVVRSRYLARRLERADASTALDTLAVTHTHRDQLFQVWDLERSISTKELTPAQVVQAAKKGIITGADAEVRLLGLGYDPTDATILLAIAGITPGGTP